jgi:hypothetical protein
VRDRSIDLVLLVLGRKVLPIDVEKLGAVKPHALRAVIERERGLGRKLYVGLERDGNAARGLAWTIARTEQI